MCIRDSDEIGPGGDVLPGGFLEVDRSADGDALGLEGGEEEGDVSLKEFEPLRGGDGAGEAHGAGGGLADGGGAGEEARHGIVELLLDVGPGGVGEGLSLIHI